MSSHMVDFSISKVKKIASRLYKDLDTPKAHEALGLLEKEDWDALVNLTVSPSEYSTAYEFMKDYQAVSFLRKCPGLPTSYDKSKIGLEKFLAAEQQCKDTNGRLSKYRPTIEVGSILELARQHVAIILGNVPKISSLRVRFGPGASSTCAGKDINLLNKLQSRLECSIEALPLVQEMLRSNVEMTSATLGLPIDGCVSLLQPLTYTIVNHNTLHFVPKDAKTDRGICIEPNSVVPLQLAFGGFIRRRLAYNGLDLNKQAFINKKFAQLGSVDGSYATIDLSSASDTISTELVRRLLPCEWFDKLYALTAQYTKLPDGTLHENEKFSSMGNGFTFELESLIFYAICLATKEHLKHNGEVMTFGDDIIVPTEIASTVVEVLEFCGFSLNKDKSFLTGPFRESCGGDYFNGYDVRPYFLKQECGVVHLAVLYPILNGIRRVSARFAGHDLMGCDSLLRRTWTCVLKMIDEPYRFFGPKDLGDVCIHSSRREAIESTGSHRLFDIRIFAFSATTTSFNSSRFTEATKVAAIRFGARPKIAIRGSGEYRARRHSVPAWSWDDYMWL